MALQPDIFPLHDDNAALHDAITAVPGRNAGLRQHNAAPHGDNGAPQRRNGPLQRRNAALQDDNAAPSGCNVALHGDNTPLHPCIPPLHDDNAALSRRNARMSSDNGPLHEHRTTLHAPPSPFPEDRMMPAWNDGSTWNSGALWGPATPASPLIPNPKRKKRNMKRQPYYPRLIANQPEWHHNFASKLPGYATALGLDTAVVNAAVADNLMLAYGLGDWITNVRNFAPSCTSALDDLTSGSGGEAFTFPTYAAPTAPTLPSGITEILPGALDRTFLLVKEIKGKQAYNETMGLDLRVVGEEDSTEHPRPEFTLKTEAGDGCHCVKVRFKKFGHYAVAVYSKRGSGGWELLGIDSGSPYEDERPLLVSGQPEIRDYKMRFWDAGEENGDWTDVASVTVSP